MSSTYQQPGAQWPQNTLRLQTGSKPGWKGATDTPLCQVTPSAGSQRGSSSAQEQKRVASTLHINLQSLTLEAGSKPKARLSRPKNRQEPRINVDNSGQTTPASTSNQSNISVAKFLSPTRSQISQRVKPLFANRNRLARQNTYSQQNEELSQGQPALSTHVLSQRASKTHQRHKELIRGNNQSSQNVNSFSDYDSDSYDQPISQCERTLDMRESNKALGKRQNEIFSIDALVKKVEQRQSSLETERPEKTKSFIRVSCLEDDKDSQEHFNCEPIAQELPLQSRKSKKRGTNSTYGDGSKKNGQQSRADNVDILNRKSQVKVRQGPSSNKQLLTDIVQKSHNHTSNPLALHQKYQTTNSTQRKQAKKTLSVSSRSSACDAVNSKSSVLKRKATKLRGSSQVSLSQMSTSNQGEAPSALQDKATVKQKVSQQFKQLLKGSQKGADKFLQLESNHCESNSCTNAASSSCGDKHSFVVCNDSSTTIKAKPKIFEKKNSVISYEASTKHRKHSKETIQLLSNKGGKTTHAHQRPSYQQTRHSALMSPVRTQTRHLGALHNKRKISAKKTTQAKQTIGSPQAQKVPAQLNQLRTLQNYPKTGTGGYQSLSLKNFVENQIRDQNQPSSVANAHTLGAVQLGKSNQVVFRSTRQKQIRAQMAIACPPDQSLNSTVLKPRDQPAASLKKRRSQDDPGSTRRLILPNQSQQDDKARVAAPQKCQLNSGIRQLLKKSKSQTRMPASKRQPLGEFNDNTGTYAAEPEEARINILAGANNFTEAGEIKAQNYLNSAAPRGDNDQEPLSEGATGSVIGANQMKRCPLQLATTDQLEQKLTVEDEPSSLLTINLLSTTHRELQRPATGKCTVGTASAINANSAKRSPQDDFKSAFDYRNFSTQPPSTINNYYQTSTGHGGEDSTPSLHIHQTDVTPPTNHNSETPPVVHSEYSKFATVPAVSTNTSQQTGQDQVSLTGSEKAKLQSQFDSNFILEQQAAMLGVTEQYLPTSTQTQKIRRKRSTRSKARVSAVNTQAASPPVITLDLSASSRRRTEPPQPFVTVTSVEEDASTGRSDLPKKVKMTSFIDQNRRSTQPPPRPQDTGQEDPCVSFAAAAESCQGGMMQPSQDERNTVMQHVERQITAEEEQASNQNLSTIKAMVPQTGEQRNAADTQLNQFEILDFNDSFFEAQQLRVSPNKPQLEMQQSSLLQVYAPIDRDEEGGAVDCEKSAINFDQILECRDLEISTKSPRASPDLGANKVHESTQNESRQSIPLQIHIEGQLMSSLDQPYKPTKKIQNWTVEQKLEKGERSSCLTKSRSNQRTDKVITPAGGRLTNMTSKKLSRNSTCLSPSACFKTVGRNLEQRNTNTSSRRLASALKGRNQSNEVIGELAMLKTTSHSRVQEMQSSNFAQQSMTKSQSQMNNSMHGGRRRLNHQKLFQVGSPITPRKQECRDLSARGDANLTHNKMLRKQKSTDRCSNNDNVSVGAHAAKSPGGRSQKSNLSVHQPTMVVLKSTKKLTQFREFAITPSQKDSNCGLTSSSAFISPLKLKKLEKRHGVSLLGGGKEVDYNNDGQDQEEMEPVAESSTLAAIQEKHANLLQDNDAMDAYMRDLCDKYF